MNTKTFYGDTCTRSPDYASGASGVVYGDIQMQLSVYDSARRIHAAGSDGEAAGRATQTEITIMRSAGIPVRTDSVGSRWWIDELAEPQAWLTPVPKEASRPSKLCGPFGGALEPTGPGYRGDRNVAPQPWR